jgi:dTDP-4-amino-4,6-dideoxygalactose transaminase
MRSLRKLADEFGVKLLVDAAQAHGLKGDLLGDAAAFSFYPTKNLGALGDGGAVVTDDPHIASQVALLRNYGSIKKNRNETIGANSRLDELQAAFLRAKLPFLDRFNARRAYNAARMGLSTSGVHHQAVLLVSNREVFRQKMAERGIETMVHYPTPPHHQPAYPNFGKFPIAERIAREIVSLPCGPELTPYQVDHVAWALEPSCS